jgi:hypothetical protein
LANGPNAALPEDTTSILKKLKKDLVIGSTIDPGNGDKGPRGITVVSNGYGKLKVGQVLVCNFEDKAGNAGKGTTVEVLDPLPGSKPVTFAQTSKVEGCSDDSVGRTVDDTVYATGLTSKLLVQFSSTGKVVGTWSKPLKAPFSFVDGACTGRASRCGYSPDDLFISDAHTGDIVSFSVNAYGNKVPTAVVSGFAVNRKSGWNALGPSGLLFKPGEQGTLFVTDGQDNTIVSINGATNLSAPSEIVVQRGGKTFKCKSKTSCAKLIKAGAPLDAPVAMTLLPNGNLVAANTHGNTLVELTISGKVLATKTVDKSKTASIFGLYAIGSDDANTAIYYSDLNDNSLHKLEQ